MKFDEMVKRLDEVIAYEQKKKSAESPEQIAVKIECEQDRTAFEKLLESYGAKISPPSKLLPEMIYANMPIKNYDACARMVHNCGKTLEKQTLYHICS